MFTLQIEKNTSQNAIILQFKYEHVKTYKKRFACSALTNAPTSLDMRLDCVCEAYASHASPHLLST